MPHHTTLIATLVAALGLAFVLGTLAQRLRVPPIVGYLLAGVCVGPFTPGYVADQTLAPQLAEIGVILLMFGVGLHFSLKDLMAVRAIAIPGAIVQIAIATLLGVGLTAALGWPLGAGLVYGLALSVASTVVLLRELQQHRLIDTQKGRIAVGWLIVEDLAMVLALVLLPALAGLLRGDAAAAPDTLRVLAITIGKVIAFVVLMIVVGRRVIPWVLHYVAHTGSRELFRLAVLATALGVAYGSAELFGVSFALGAFFAGMVLSESELSQRAADETLPLRDAFAVLFFAAVGMLFDPGILLRDPWMVLATLFIIVIGKSLAALLIVLAFRHPLETALTVAASLAQIGEFSFILAALGVSLELLPERGRDLILAGAILSILINPLFFVILKRLARRQHPPAAAGEPLAVVDLPVSALSGHSVLAGFGRVGSVIGEELQRAGRPFLVIEERPDATERLRDSGIEALCGNAAAPDFMTAANVAQARQVFVAVPDGFEAGQIVEQARRINPGIRIIARAHSEAAADHLRQAGADIVVMAERETARAMLERAFAPDPPARPAVDLSA